MNVHDIHRSQPPAAGKITTTEEVITIEMAEAWLENNLNRNRPISTPHVNELAKRIKNGDWMLTGQAILFDSAGHLIDGQHRLSALCLAGPDYTLRSLVTRGIYDKGAFLALDEGKRRSASDLLVMTEGHFDNAVHRTSAARIIYGLLQCRDNLSVFRMNRIPIQNKTLVRFTNSLPEMDQAIGLALGARGVCTPAVLTAAAVILLRIQPDKAEIFIKALKSGLGFANERDPIRLLRDQLLKVKNSSNRVGKLTALAKVFRSWNLWIENKPCKSLHWQEKGNNFPIPNGFDVWRQQDV